VIKIEQELLELYRDPELVSKPDLLDQRGGAYYSEAAVELIASLLGNVPSGSVSSANIRNNGALPFLDDQAVIETMCTISPLGATALEIPTVDPALAGLISHVSAYEELAVDAAIHGGRDRVVKALFAHPLIGQWEQANKLADLLIASNKDHLAWA
jgi:6-phospho-beta-glucosidase